MPIKPSSYCAIWPAGLTRRPGVAASILEGLDEMLTVTRLGLPVKLRRSLACTNSIENMMGTARNPQSCSTPEKTFQSRWAAIQTKKCNASRIRAGSIGRDDV
jgi:hypothetical protein